MPQMAPILWYPLFIFFSFLFTLLGSFLFFEKSMIMDSKKESLSLKTNFWMW